MKLIFACVLMLLASALGATTWHLRKPMLVARSDMTATAVGDQIIVAGGCDSSQVCPSTADFCYCTSITDKAHAYIPEDNKWEVLNPMPTPRFRHGAAAVGNKLFVFGGRDLDDNIITSVDVYDTQSKRWSTLASAWSQATSDLVGLASGNTVYAIGGYAQDYSSVQTTYTLDATAGSPSFTLSSVVPAMSSDRGDACGVASDDGKLYMYGGFTDLNFCQPLGTMEVFDTKNPNAGWQQKASLHQPRGDSACGFAHGVFHALGGEQKDNVTGCSKFSVPIKDVESFDPDTNTWREEQPLPDVRFRFAYATYKNTFYLFGGQTDLSKHEYDAVNTVEAWYDDDLSSANTLIQHCSTIIISIALCIVVAGF
jgi:N-acetylneuraminic acid mutarotase